LPEIALEVTDGHGLAEMDVFAERDKSHSARSENFPNAILVSEDVPRNHARSFILARH
jgi:hypothetical protein